MGNMECLNRPLGGNAIGPERKNGEGRKFDEDDVFRKYIDACYSHDPYVEDVKLSKRLLKELENPSGLGDTYAHDQVISAYRRIEELFGGKGPEAMLLPGLFPEWKDLCMRMKSMDYPNVWSSKDPLFIGALSWAAQVLRGNFKTAKTFADEYERNLRLMADEDARVVFEKDKENGIEYSKSPGAVDVFVEFGLGNREGDEVLQRRHKAVCDWVEKKGMKIEWRWFERGYEGFACRYRAVKSPVSVPVADHPECRKSKGEALAAAIWHLPGIVIAAAALYLAIKYGYRLLVW